MTDELNGWTESAQRALAAGYVGGNWESKLANHLMRWFPEREKELRQIGAWKDYLITQTQAATDLYLRLTDEGTNAETARELALEQLLPRPPDEEDKPEPWELEGGEADISQGALDYLSDREGNETTDDQDK